MKQKKKSIYKARTRFARVSRAFFALRMRAAAFLALKLAIKMLGTHRNTPGGPQKRPTDPPIKIVSENGPPSPRLETRKWQFCMHRSTGQEGYMAHGCTTKGDGGGGC